MQEMPEEILFFLKKQRGKGGGGLIHTQDMTLVVLYEIVILKWDREWLN